MKKDKKQEEWPQDNKNYLFKNLSTSERWTISLVYSQTWKKLVNIKNLKKNERAYFKLYFKEIHARYYLRVIQGHPYVNSSRIILNFLLSKANENLRALLSGLQSYNLTVFVHAIRSQ
ncbi:MAG: hypothetical protein JW781_08545, partial [Deltaproteobacteria bacterium]|nr:hypothetical protein [Candidatus Anaeroferrophillacea bacterium]